MLKTIRLFMDWVPECKGKLALAAAYKAVESTFAGLSFAFVYLVLEAILTHGLTTGKIALYTAAMAACFLLQGLFYYLFVRTAWPAANHVVKQLRLKIGEHLRRLSMGYFSATTTGSLHTLMADEMLTVQMVIYQAFPGFVTAIVFSTLAPLCLLPIDWRLALAVAAVIPPALVLLFRPRNKIARSMAGRSAALAEANAQLIEYVQGMEVLKAFGKNKAYSQRLAKGLEEFRDASKKTALAGQIPVTLARIVLDLGFCLIFLAAAGRLLTGGVSPSVALIFLIMGLRIYGPIKLLIPAMVILQWAAPAVSKIEDLLDTPPLPQPSAGKGPDKYDIVFDKVTFGYGRQPVLRNVDFTISEKTITALVGPSGAGKTTVTRLIARFWDVDSGAIRIGGHDIRKIPADRLLSRLSMVFQDVYLFNDTVYRNIAYGALDAAGNDVVRAARLAGCHDFITRLPQGYDTVVGEGGATLSGGERQRISIARAILKDAPHHLARRGHGIGGSGKRVPDPAGDQLPGGVENRDSHRPPALHHHGGGPDHRLRPPGPGLPKPAATGNCGPGEASMPGSGKKGCRHAVGASISRGPYRPDAAPGNDQFSRAGVFIFRQF